MLEVSEICCRGLFPVCVGGLCRWCGGRVVVRGVVKLVGTPFAPFCRGKRIGCRPVRTCTGVLMGGKLRKMFVGKSSNRKCVLASRRHVGLTRH